MPVVQSIVGLRSSLRSLLMKRFTTFQPNTLMFCCKIDGSLCNAKAFHITPLVSKELTQNFDIRHTQSEQCTSRSHDYNGKISARSVSHTERNN